MPDILTGFFKYWSQEGIFRTDFIEAIAKAMTIFC